MEAIIVGKPREFKMDPIIWFYLWFCDYLSIPCAVRAGKLGYLVPLVVSISGFLSSFLPLLQLSYKFTCQWVNRWVSRKALCACELAETSPSIFHMLFKPSDACYRDAGFAVVLSPFCRHQICTFQPYWSQCPANLSDWIFRIKCRTPEVTVGSRWQILYGHFYLHNVTSLGSFLLISI